MRTDTGIQIGIWVLIAAMFAIFGIGVATMPQEELPSTPVIYDYQEPVDNGGQELLKGLLASAEHMEATLEDIQGSISNINRSLTKLEDKTTQAI